MPTVGHVEEDFGHGRLGWGKMQDRPCRPLWERYAAQKLKATARREFLSVFVMQVRAWA